MRVRALELVDSFQSLVNPRVALPEPIARLTGLREQELRGAPSVSSVLSPLPRVRGRRPARRAQRPVRPALPRAAAGRPAPVASRRSARPRSRAACSKDGVRRVGLASLAALLRRSDAALPPRAARRRGDGPGARAPDRARAGARREDAVRAARPRRAPQAQGSRQAARSPAARRRGPACTCSATGTTRCSTSAAPATCAHGCARTSAATASGRRSRRPCSRSTRIEWRVLGSELEAALEELRLIRELEPPANSRSRRKEQGVYLRRRGDEFVVSKTARARSARSAAGGKPPSPRARSPRARTTSSTACSRAGRCPACGHGSTICPRASATRRRPGCATGSRRSSTSSSACAGWTGSAAARALPDRTGRRAGLAEGLLRLRRRCRAVRPLPPGAGARLEIEAGLALCRSAGEPEDTLTAAEAEDLMLLHGFIRRPPPELAVLPLDPERIAEHLGRRRLPRAA